MGTWFLVVISILAGASWTVRAELTAQDLAGKDAPAGAVWLDAQDLRSVETGYGKVGAGKTVDSKPLLLNKRNFAHGLGVHATSLAGIELKKAATRFTAVVGLDDEVGRSGSVVFQVWVDDVKKADSGLMKGGDEAKLFSVDLTGAGKMALVVTDGGDGAGSDHADWAGAAVFTSESALKVVPAEFAALNVMPQIASCDPAKTAIHGPRVVGTTPGRPFIFLVPATGEGLRKHSARGLPAGLKLSPETGIISGSVEKAGTYKVTLSVKGKNGSASRKLIIEAGDHKLARTPPMGWNSWNCWAGALDDAKVRAAADAMIKSGLAAHGYQYINIDDCWQKGRNMKDGRDANGEIIPNDKFPDMQALAAYVHSKGLRLGIYSSPGPTTCATFTGSYQHEEQDAKTYARWGMDYLKYDWCSYGDVGKCVELEDFKRPYRIMRAALDQCGRDMVFSMCQYGMHDVWQWGAEVGGNCWRTTGDIEDTWGSLAGIAFGQNGHERFAGPGHWNDPDMLVVGRVGWGANLHPTRLKYPEQVTHLTMWSLLAAPLLIGCDMTQMDPFTVDLLTNDEVLDVNQDPLGQPARRVAGTVDGIQVWCRPLQDGTTAVGVFNTSFEALDGVVKWSDIGVQGRKPVRDLWLQKDLGSFDGQYAACKVPAHGAIMLKVGTSE